MAREEEERKKKSGGGKQPSPGERLLFNQEKSCDDSAIDEPGEGEEEEELADEDKCDKEGEDEEDWSESPPLSDEEDQGGLT